MGFVSQLSTVTSVARPYALTSEEYRRAFFAGEDVPSAWFPSGIEVSPDLALTLSYVYSATDIISADFGTMTCQLFRDVGNDARERVGFTEAGIGALAFQLRWQPNPWQTAKAFWSTLAWQYLLRPSAYAELVYRPGSTSMLQALIPRHPDRVTERMLPSGRVQFRLLEPNGSTRYVTQDEMFVIRNTSADGLHGLSRVQYGGAAIQAGLSLQDFTRNYFHKGATAALLATYKGGQKTDTDEATLHKSITRYMSGAENAGGLLLVPEDIDIKGLGVDPEKAQLLGLKSLSGRDVARLFKMPPSWLGIENSTSYASETQDEARYIKHVQMPLVVEVEQAIQRDLIVASGTFFAKFNMDYLLRGDLLARMQAYEIGIRSRVIRPSEARVKEDMNRDLELDRLSAADHRPGAPSEPGRKPAAGERSNALAVRATLLLHDNAARCLRRERAEVEKLARKHAADAEGWQAGLADFYRTHAPYVAQTMRMPIQRAQTFAEAHREALAHRGIGLLEGEPGAAWEREEAETLCVWSVDETEAA